MRGGIATTLAAVVALAGCRDEELECPIEEPWRPAHIDCRSARALAARDSANIVVSRGDLEWHLDVYRRGFTPFSHLMASPPTAAFWWSLIVVSVADERVRMPWMRGEVLTGLDHVDDVLRRAYVSKVDAVPVEGVFYLQSSRWLVPRIFARELEQAAELERVSMMLVADEPQIFTQTDDVVIEPHAEEATELFIVYRRGWGDCVSQCDGQHWWRVRVTETDAELISDWGAPIPPEVLELWKRPHPE